MEFMLLGIVLVVGAVALGVSYLVGRARAKKVTEQFVTAYSYTPPMSEEDRYEQSWNAHPFPVAPKPGKETVYVAQASVEPNSDSRIQKYLDVSQAYLEADQKELEGEKILFTELKTETVRKAVSSMKTVGATSLPPPLPSKRTTFSTPKMPPRPAVPNNKKLDIPSSYVEDSSPLPSFSSYDSSSSSSDSSFSYDSGSSSSSDFGGGDSSGGGSSSDY